MKTKEMKTNIAPSSTHGHFIEMTKKVIELDKINETFYVEEPSELTTNNHTTIINDEECIITCQQVYNHFTGKSIKSQD